MARQNEISQTNFEDMLAWLDTDREIAGRKYEAIRRRLIEILFARGCHLAEEMADETIDRVTGKINTLFGNYTGEPALYFYGVAKKVFLEYSRRPRSEELSAALPQNESSSSQEAEPYHECLDKCLQTFAPKQRDFITRYYQKEKQAKLEERKQMKKELGVSDEVLRIRAFRIRKILQKCVSNCVEKTADVTF